MKSRTLIAALCVIMMALAPTLALAKPKNGGHDGGQGESTPSAKSSAYEHASDKANFQRDTHDMGKHQGQENTESDDKGKSNGEDKNKGKKEADTDKGKGMSDAGKGTDKDAEHISNDKSKNEHKGLLDESAKPKKEKVK